MRLVGLIALLFALVVTAAAAGVGPSLPDVNGDVSISEVSYVTSAHGSSTTLSKRVEGKVDPVIVVHRDRHADSHAEKDR